ncbi:MAG TPA: hypothetical protein VI790_00105 [Candidatus Nanoarchaeia archaeon]|nr:hypothetical protein [Candidatus Nanoarchaeia archaeon]
MQLANKELLSDLLKKNELTIGILKDDLLEMKIESVSKRVKIENTNRIEEIINYAIKEPTKDSMITASIKLDFNAKENIYITLAYLSKEESYNMTVIDYKKSDASKTNKHKTKTGNTKHRAPRMRKL